MAKDLTDVASKKLKWFWTLSESKVVLRLDGVTSAAQNFDVADIVGRSGADRKPHVDT